MEADRFIRLPFKELGMEEAFNRQCRRMGFSCLEDIFVLAPAELFKKPGFSYLWLEKLSQFLKEKDLLHLLQATPGRSAY